MSLLDDVSIVVTPNGYKAGELYAVVPVPTEGSNQVINGNFATDTDWGKAANWTISSGKAISNGSGLMYQTSVSYVDGKTYKVTFDADITSGAGSVRLGNTSSVTAFANGVNEFYLQTNASNTTRYIFFQGNSFVGSVDNVSVKEYTSADMDVTRATDATRVNESGLIEDVLANVPRIDYTGGGCPHILAEPQTTNLITYSEDFSQWNNAGDVTIESGYLAPDGTNNAYKVSGSDWITLAASLLTTTTRSIYARTISGTGQANLCSHNSNTNNLFTITDQWQRFDVTTSNSTGVGAFYAVDFRGGTTLSEIILWGANATNDQAYPTSYIPTSGSTVTRNQDIFTRDGIGSLINSTEGVLFVEMAALSDDLTNRRITISDGVGGNDVGFRFNNSSNTIQVVSYINSSVIVNESYVLSDITVIKKYALKWALNNYALWVDGVEVITDISAISFPADTLNTLNFGSATGSSPFYGKVKQLQVYNTALTDEQLTSLTS